MPLPAERDVGRRPPPPPPPPGNNALMSVVEEGATNRRIISTNPEFTPMEVDETHVSTDKDSLKATKIDLDETNNTNAHHTNEFGITDPEVYKAETDTDILRKELVVRRGQSFDMTVEFNKAYDPEKDDVSVVFQTGQYPIPSKRTQIELVPSKGNIVDDWGAFIQSNVGNTLRLTVMTPATCAVGRWALMVDCDKRSGDNVQTNRYKHTSPIYILFNPWCKDDSVYMLDEESLKEYILNETGKLYVGSHSSFTSIPWAFNQYKGDILDSVMYLLDQSNLSAVDRSNPIIVSRKMSLMVNDEVLMGRWNGNYADGVSPLNWTGSDEILEQFLDTKQMVRYGQCWVFSGVLTTVCRALGIPARSVTNFASAHDTDSSITIDYHIDAQGDEIGYLNRDSIWNFHVWNDVWMTRPDLPPGYGGWQAIDATPQERSDGFYQMGPASLEAIRKGEVYLPYDGPFVFAEVNGDRITHKKNEDGKFEVTNISKHMIGKHMSTKRGKGTASWRELGVLYDKEREDVTDQYKFPEGSDEERAAAYQAHRFSTPEEKKDVYNIKDRDVTFELHAEKVFFGDTVKFGLKIKNTSAQQRTIHGHLRLSSVFYTGINHKLIRKTDIDYTSLEANEEKTIDVEVEPTTYKGKLTDHFFLAMSSMCYVEETKQTFTAMDTFRLRKPHLEIKAPAKARVGKEFELEVSYVNKLLMTLTECELRVEGPGLKRHTIYKNLPDVGEGEIFTKKINMRPFKIGPRQIIVCFNCKEISSVNVSASIDVLGRE